MSAASCLVFSLVPKTCAAATREGMSVNRLEQTETKTKTEAHSLDFAVSMREVMLGELESFSVPCDP